MPLEEAEAASARRNPSEKPAARKPAEQPAAKTVTIRGKVVDDATGEPIERLTCRRGKFDPADPKKVTWGYCGEPLQRPRRFLLDHVRWDEGWTARIVADGYIPQPVLASAPPADKDEIEVTIRLKRGPNRPRRRARSCGQTGEGCRGLRHRPDGAEPGGRPGLVDRALGRRKDD